MTMDGVSDRFSGDFERFASRWLAPLVAAFLRAVRSPALAYDLATETLAAARLRWTSAPDGPRRVAWLIELGVDVLAATVERTRVPTTERRRNQQPVPQRLSVAEQRELTALAEARLDLPADAQAVAEGLARTAPPAHVLRELRCSDLVEAAPLPDPDRERRGV